MQNNTKTDQRERSKSRKVVPWTAERNRPNDKERIQDSPPHSVEAEQGVLGSMLQPHGGSEAITEAIAKIGAEYFFVPAHQTIFTAIGDLWDAGQAVDLIALTQSLRDKNLLDSVGGAALVTNVATFVPTAANVGYYLDIVREKYVRREVIAACAEAARRLSGEQDDDLSSLDALTSKVTSIRSVLGRDGAAEKSWPTALAESVITASELNDLKLTPRQKLLGDWMCEGDLGFIFAPRGVGKTWEALAIAQALSTGGKLGEWQAHDPVKVLYVDGEMPPDLMRDRTNGLQASNDNLEVLNHEILFDRTGKTLNIANREVQQAITDHCIKTCVKVLILDNLSTLASGMKENEADAWELVNNWLLDLRRRKVAVVIVHHAGRSGEMRGTSKREDNVFWIIALDDRKKDADDKRGARFISHFTKPSRNTQHEVPAYEWHFVTEANGDVSISHKQAQTLDVFRSVIESGITKTDEIADAMKLRNYEVSRMAKKAMDEGWLGKLKRGEYVLKGDKQ